jgi:hypothetical protein
VCLRATDALDDAQLHELVGDGQPLAPWLCQHPADSHPEASTVLRLPACLPACLPARPFGVPLPLDRVQGIGLSRVFLMCVRR